MRGSSRFARTLRRQGIKPGEVVVLILQHGEDLVYSFWGAILHGAIPAIMPFLTEKLSPERYRADLAALISVTRPSAIVTYPEFEADVRSALKEGEFRSRGDPDESDSMNKRGLILTRWLGSRAQLTILFCSNIPLAPLACRKAWLFRIKLCSINWMPMPKPCN